MRLPSIGSTIRLVVEGRELRGLVDGYSVRLGVEGRLLWLVENPGVGELTRVHVDAIEDWGHVV